MLLLLLQSLSADRRPRDRDTLGSTAITDGMDTDMSGSVDAGLCRRVRVGCGLRAIGTSVAADGCGSMATGDKETVAGC